MASTSKPRRLAELLEEQQEPFVLEIYLLERGFCPNNFDTTSSYISSNRTKCRTSKHYQFLNVARNVCNKLVSMYNVVGLAHSGLSGVKKHEGNRLEREFDRTNDAADSDRISFGSSCNSFYASATMELNGTCEAAPGGAMKLWRDMGDNKECSPVSVLDEIDFLQGFSVYNVRQENRHLASRTKLQKMKLGDSISLRGSTRQLSVDKANIKQTVRSELISGLKNEWSDWEACKRLIVLEIQDSVLEEIMDEIVTDMSFINFSKYHYSL